MVILFKVLPSLWLLFLSTVCSYEFETNSNVTTLYPIENKTATNNETDKPRLNPETRSSTKNQQIWTLESGFVESNITEDEYRNATDSNSEEKEHKILENLKENELKPNGNKVKNEHKEMLEGFKPSQHLGSFFDEDSAEVIKTPSFGLIGKKPSSGFINSHREEGLLPFNKKPYKSFHHTHKPFPYKFEEPIFTQAKDWDSIESRPTVESPVRVPAGGLYQSPHAFKDSPLSGEEFGQEVIEHEKEHSIKKRVNPWQDLLRLATAFIPVGLIISALTPNVVTLQNVDAPAPNPYRRSDVTVPDMSPISENCRRRLLCEIHSERNFTPNSSSCRAKHCYKLHCEDTEALWKVLRWMFSYNQGPEKAKHFT